MSVSNDQEQGQEQQGQEQEAAQYLLRERVVTSRRQMQKQN